MMRWAVFSPMPFTDFSTRSLPVRMTFVSSWGVNDEMIIRAVLPPTPLTVSSCRNSSRSSLPAKPNSVWASSLMAS